MLKEEILKSPPCISEIGIGRLLQALPDLCPALRTCCLAPKLLKIEDLNAHQDFMFLNKSSTSKAEPEWQNLKLKLESKANDFFKLWISSVIKNLKEDLSKALVNHPEANLKLMPAWDTIEISEQGEDDQIVKSKIRVPQHLSFPAYENISKFCKICHKAGIHSLPMQIQNELSQSAALTLSQVYRDFCNVNTKLTQNLAFQLHFDVQFFMLILISHDHLSITDECQKVLNTLENHIDPFDFSVFSPYVSAHVKKCVLRHQSLISVMIPNDKYTLLSSLKASIPAKANNNQLNGHHIDQPSDHNVLNLAPNISRFSLLPIVTSGGHPRGRGEKVNKTLTASNLPQNSAIPINKSGATRKRSKSPVAKTANSFFEAMSNSWFGTK